MNFLFGSHVFAMSVSPQLILSGTVHEPKAQGELNEPTASRNPSKAALHFTLNMQTKKCCDHMCQNIKKSEQGLSIGAFFQCPELGVRCCPLKCPDTSCSTCHDQFAARGCVDHLVVQYCNVIDVACAYNAAA